MTVTQLLRQPVESSDLTKTNLRLQQNSIQYYLPAGQKKEQHQQSLNYQKERRRKGKKKYAITLFGHGESNPGLPVTVLMDNFRKAGGVPYTISECYLL
jgi:hypothetical protein